MTTVLSVVCSLVVDLVATYPYICCILVRQQCTYAVRNSTLGFCPLTAIIITYVHLLIQQQKDQQKKSKKNLFSKLAKVARGSKRKGWFCRRQWQWKA